MYKESTKIYDTHIHTEFAYCSLENMNPDAVIGRMDALGLAGIAFTEHAAQLYISEQDYWTAKFIENPSLIHQYPRNRMNGYRKYIWALRSERVKAGLEVEVDTCGHLAVMPQDAVNWDILLGAVHWLPERFNKHKYQGFIWAVERLAIHGIDVLAHPFRIFHKMGESPYDLYQDIVDILVSAGVCVEINFHTNKPDRDFFAMCIDSGVKIALGSDAHCMEEAGNLDLHMDFLNEICGTRQLNEVLWMP